MNGSPLIIISLIISGAALIVGGYALITAAKARAWRRLLADKQAPADFEQLITGIAARIEGLEHGQSMAQGQIAELEQMLSRNIQCAGLIRFNSLADEGGNLSFALALLDAHHDGIVLTSLHGRQQNRIYAKPIHGGNSEIKLSEEE